jgi:DNA-binding transcriptional regulator YiaG
MKTLTAEQFRQIRLTMGLSCQQMADWLYISGRWGERNIRRWESDTHPVPGSVVKALELAGMLE